jgi:hypothetical protein
MKKSDHRRGHVYHLDGLSTVGIALGIAAVGFIVYNIFNVIFS